MTSDSSSKGHHGSSINRREGLIAVAVAVAINVALFYGFEAMGIELRVRPNSGELIDMTPAPVVVVTGVPSLMALVVAVVLDRVTANARVVFSGVVVLVAFLSLLMLTTLDSSTMDRVFQGVMHLVPAAAFVA